MSKTLLAALALLGAAGFAAKTQAPEVQRYLKVRRM
jgi:hypothetical protein